MKRSTIVSQAIIKYVNGGQKPLIRYDAPFGLVHVPIAGFNMTEQFVGGARISIIPSSAGTIFIVNNTTDRYSGGYHAATSIPRVPGEVTPTGTIYQRFIWVIKND